MTSLNKQVDIECLLNKLVYVLEGEFVSLTDLFYLTRLTLNCESVPTIAQIHGVLDNGVTNDFNVESAGLTNLTVKDLEGAYIVVATNDRYAVYYMGLNGPEAYTGSLLNRKKIYGIAKASYSGVMDFVQDFERNSHYGKVLNTEEVLNILCTCTNLTKYTSKLDTDTVLNKLDAHVPDLLLSCSI